MTGARRSTTRMPSPSRPSSASQQRRSSMPRGVTGAALIPTFTYVPRIVIDRFLERERAAMAAAAAAASPVQEPLSLLFTAPESVTYGGAAVLIADVSGFTKLNEQFNRLGSGGAEKVSKHLNVYFTTLLDVIDRHGG